MRKIAILMVVLLLLIPIVLAVKPVVTYPQSEGALDIIYPKNEFFYFNTTISLHFHVYNLTGHLLTAPTTTCSLHVYNNTGSHIVENESLNMDSNGVDYSIKLGKDIINKVGVYPYLIACNNTKYGGGVSTQFIVSLNGEISKDTETTTYRVEKSIFTYSLGIILLLLSLFLIFTGADDLRVKNEN